MKNTKSTKRDISRGRDRRERVAAISASMSMNTTTSSNSNNISISSSRSSEEQVERLRSRSNNALMSRAQRARAERERRRRGGTGASAAGAGAGAGTGSSSSQNNAQQYQQHPQQQSVDPAGRSSSNSSISGSGSVTSGRSLSGTGGGTVKNKNVEVVDLNISTSSSHSQRSVSTTSSSAAQRFQQQQQQQARQRDIIDHPLQAQQQQQLQQQQLQQQQQQQQLQQQQMSNNNASTGSVGGGSNNSISVNSQKGNRTSGNNNNSNTNHNNTNKNNNNISNNLPSRGREDPSAATPTSSSSKTGKSAIISQQPKLQIGPSASTSNSTPMPAALPIPPSAINAISKPIINAATSNLNMSLNSKLLPSSSSSSQKTQAISVESPLPPLVQRCLGDRSYEKRKNAALEVETLVKSLADPSNHHHSNNNNNSNIHANTNLPMIASLIQILSKDFCTSMNSNYRKGGLIGLAATAIGLMPYLTTYFLQDLLKPVLQCFDDPESRVRYYACESLYNIAKVSRGAVLNYFNLIFDGLTKLFADVDDDVKNGANLLDRLIKDIVTESDNFDVELFLPMLQNYIRRTNPYIRQLLVGWITVLDGIPDVSMIDYLPDFLDGLFNMLSDSNREIRQAADSALCEFLREVRSSTVVEFGPIVSILVFQCHSKERLNRLTAISWIAELIHHPYSGGDALLPFHSEVLGAIMRCISDVEVEIRKVSERTNADLLILVKDTHADFELGVLLDVLTKELLGKDDVPTKMAALRWINMLLEKRRADMDAFVANLLPVLLKTLSDTSDAVVLLNLQVLSRISLPPLRNLSPNSSSAGGNSGTGANDFNRDDGTHEQEQPHSSTSTRMNKFANRKSATTAAGQPKPISGDNSTSSNDRTTDDSQFQMVLNAILKVFASDRRLLETRGSLIVRKLCVLLNAKSVYIRMADALSSYDTSDEGNDAFTLEFIATMVQTLNLILLTGAELHSLRVLLAESFVKKPQAMSASGEGDKAKTSMRLLNHFAPSTQTEENEGAKVFASLFNCWCHNPVATFSLCLLARTYDVAFALVKKFSELEVTVGFLMQIDKLVNLLESPIFVHLRLQLLDVEAPYHTHLLKSCYGLLMLLPQSDAFRSLNDRLATVCNLRDNLGIMPHITASPADGPIKSTEDSSVAQAGLDSSVLLERFDEVMAMHRNAREAIQHQNLQQDQGVNGGTGVARKNELFGDPIPQHWNGPSQSSTGYTGGSVSLPHSTSFHPDMVVNQGGGSLAGILPGSGLK